MKLVTTALRRAAARCIAIAATLPLLLLVPAARADTVRVGSYAQPGDFALVREDDEILAPILLGLKNAGYGFVARGRTLQISSPAGREIILTLDSIAARVGGEPFNLRVAPRLVERRWFLPVRSLADALGMAISIDEARKELALTPRVTELRVDRSRDDVVVLVAAQAPISYATGQLVEPPRAFVDLENLTLAEGARRIDVNAGLLLAVRAAVQSKTEPGTRIVLDLTGQAVPEVVPSDNGCSLTVRIPKSAQTTTAPKALLESVSFRRTSPKSAVVLLTLSAPATATSEMRDGGKLLAVRLFGVGRKVEQLPEVAGDDLVEGITVRSLGGAQDVQELRIALKRSTRHMLSAQGKTVRVILGDLSLDGMRIALDPGHGGFLPGTIGRSGLMEKDVNLDIALRLERLLTEAGVKVYMTRSEDCELCPVQDERGRADTAKKRAELYMRPRLANSVGADLFISIHNNSAGDKSDRCGTEVYYWTPQSKALAESLHEAVVSSCGTRAGVISGARNFVVIREAKMPSCLVEVAYLSNRDEEALLATEEFRQKAADGVFQGIKRYVMSGGTLGCPPAAPSTAAPASDIEAPATAAADTPGPE